jgi:hypothetical protein
LPGFDRPAQATNGAPRAPQPAGRTTPAAICNQPGCPVLNPNANTTASMMKAKLAT